MMRRKERNQMLGGVRARAGRRPVKIDLIELEKLASSLMCTDEELAAFFGVSVRTIETRRKQPQFSSDGTRQGERPDPTSASSDADC